MHEEFTRAHIRLFIRRIFMNFCRTMAAATFMCFAVFTNAETITILHTNDFHSKFQPINRFDNICSAEDNQVGQCYGGIARLATSVRQNRAESPNLLLLDAGDQFQGSLFYSKYQGQTSAEMMNLVGYDAMGIGNHEFDGGPERLRAFVDAVNFPVLISNADVSAEPKLAEVLMPSTVIERGGFQYGLIGLVPANTQEISSPENTLIFTDPVEALRREIDNFNAQGINRIIVLSHSGFPIDLDIAAKVNGIDLIVGGHSNTLLSNSAEKADGPYPTWVTTPEGGRTAVVQAYAYGKYLGRLNVTFDDQGVVQSAIGEPILLDHSIPEDEKVKARIAELAVPLAELLEEVIAEAATTVDGSGNSCRKQQCEVGTLVATAMLQHMKPFGVDIAIANAGGIRASLQKGPISSGDILTTFPFEDVLSRFKLKGSDVVAALENGVSGVEEMQGRFPQVAGIRFEFTLSKQPNNGRILKVEVMQDGNWVPLDSDKVYSVTTDYFLRSGRDGYSVLADNAINPYDGMTLVTDVVADYLTANSPYTAINDNRIVQK